jgi:hypothetical protein
VSFVVEVPEPIQDEIRALDLSLEVEDQLYSQLEDELADGPGTCQMLQFFTFVKYLDVQDPLISGITHRFTFFLTYGRDDNQLVVKQFFYDPVEAWSDEDDGERDYGDDPPDLGDDF